ncbi:TolC family protein, partial [Candidatus Aminicenantes bacterium AC-335-G13]|nr:TolC family protein [Candidatus Aminicenantes bacterium AC-335-G13]
ILIILLAGNSLGNIESILNLNELINEALNNNPQIIAARKKWEAYREKIPQAGALPDPVISLGLMNLPVNSFDFNQEPMTGKKLSIMQMIPFPGKLKLKEKIALSEYNSVGQNYKDLRNTIIKNVKITFYDLFFIDKSIEITRKNKLLLQQFVKIAETKYSVGKGLQQDVLKAQVELSKLIEKLINLQQKRETIKARLNTLLNRPPESPLGKILEIKKSKFNLSLEKLKQIALENRPLLKAWEYIIKKYELAYELAKKDYFPNFNLSFSYTQREDLKTGMKMYDFFSGMVSFNIPLYFSRKQKKKIEETALNIAMSKEQYNSLKNEIFFQIENILEQLKRDEELIELYKTGIIPQATQSLNSAISGYQVDKIDFITLLHNQVTLFNYEIDYYRILTDFEKKLAELEAIIGKQLTNEE